MKTVCQSALLYGALLISAPSVAQAVTNQSPGKPKNEEKMETSISRLNHGATIRKLYEVILNNRKFDMLPEVISGEFAGFGATKGVKGFQEPIVGLINAFPDIQWNIEELVCEGNKIAVRWKWVGTHLHDFQTYKASGKTISNSGMAIYEMKDEKVIDIHIITDRLGFLQDLGIVPANISSPANNHASSDAIRFIDKFFVPQNSVGEFRERMYYNRAFIKKLPGFVGDEVYQQTDESGTFIIVTIATWSNPESVTNAKNAVLAEYKRIGFDPSAFYQRLNIKMERGLYYAMKE